MSADKNTLNSTFVQDVREMLAQARQKAYATVHFIMVETYWRVGRRIVEEEQQGKERADYGAFLIRELSRSLSTEFGKGFAVANLWNFRQFYLVFPTEEKLYALRRELTWSHYRLIMRVDKPEARDFYLREAATQGWSTRQLERNIQTHFYERLLSAPGELHPAETERLRPTDFVKDPYVLEFLHLPENPWGTEKTLESALIENLQQFLLELGKGFSFVGRQFRISTESSHFYIDLVFYNYLLKCFVLLDLKTGKLSHQEVGMSSEWKEYRLEKSEYTGVPKINLSYLKNFSVSFPPQPRIASILTALDDKIELNRRMTLHPTLINSLRKKNGQGFLK